MHLVCLEILKFLFLAKGRRIILQRKSRMLVWVQTISGAKSFLANRCFNMTVLVFICS